MLDLLKNVYYSKMNLFSYLKVSINSQLFKLSENQCSSLIKFLKNCDFFAFKSKLIVIFAQNKVICLNYQKISYRNSAQAASKSFRWINCTAPRAKRKFSETSSYLSWLALPVRNKNSSKNLSCTVEASKPWRNNSIRVIQRSVRTLTTLSQNFSN